MLRPERIIRGLGFGKKTRYLGIMFLRADTRAHRGNGWGFVLNMHWCRLNLKNIRGSRFCILKLEEHLDVTRHAHDRNTSGDLVITGRNIAAECITENQL